MKSIQKNKATDDLNDTYIENAWKLQELNDIFTLNEILKQKLSVTIEQNSKKLAKKRSKKKAEVYCICQSSRADGFMIFCEGSCQQWFHIDCIGMTVKYFKFLQQNKKNKFVC